jgi:ribose 1,5-bisphosphokinase
MSKLFYVIGASGAGKDTLINFARTRVNGSNKIIFAHRYITRPAFSGNENHVQLSVEEFKARIDADLFALYWESHGKYYGIGKEINSWMDNGFNVIVNGSRQYLPVAQRLYPNIVVILIDASPEVINERLSNRGREDAGEIAKRITRTAEINTDLSSCIKIMNDGAIEDAGGELVNVIASKQTAFI